MRTPSWWLPAGVEPASAWLLASRMLRGFADGYVAVLLPAYLGALGLGVVEIAVLAGGPGLESRGMDLTVSIATLAACGIYLWFALRTVYGARGVGGVLLAAILATGAAALVLAYRFVVFLITLYTT